MLLAATIVACLFAFVVRPLLRQATALRQLHAAGVRVEDYVSVTDDWLKQQLGFDPFEVSAVDVRTPEGVDALVRHADQLGYLDQIAFHQGATDATLERAAQLQRLPSLTAAAIYSNALTDDGVRHLAAWTNLEELFINGPRLTDAGLDALGDCHNLKSLVVMSESNLPPLPATDAGVASLARLSNLRTLWLLNLSVSSEGLLQLASLDRLERLHVGRPDLADLAYQRLCDALPNCHVTTASRLVCNVSQVARLEVVDSSSGASVTSTVQDAEAVAELLAQLQTLYDSNPSGWAVYDKRAPRPPGLWFEFWGSKREIMSCGVVDHQFYSPATSRKRSVSREEEASIRRALR